VDVYKNQRIYLEDPEPVIPPANPGKGRAPTKLKAQKTPIRADEWAEQQPDEKWKRTYVRDTTKGKLLVDILHKRVWHSCKRKNIGLNVYFKMPKINAEWANIKPESGEVGIITWQW
jgi:hypothetical protein